MRKMLKNVLSVHGRGVFCVQVVSSDWFCAAVNFLERKMYSASLELSLGVHDVMEKIDSNLSHHLNINYRYTLNFW